MSGSRANTPGVPVGPNEELHRGLWRRALWVGAAVCCGLPAPGCGSAQSRYDTLSFFFDGVPNPADKAKGDGGADKPTPAATAAAANITKPGAPRVWKHPPFAERSCHDCHADDYAVAKLVDGQPFCFQCHDEDLLAGKVKHPPAQEGDCLECHDPHQSTASAALLRSPTATLCFECHDADDEGFAARHKPLGKPSGCERCHEPHAGKLPKMLKALRPQDCRLCHTGVPAPKEHPHAPVAADCANCHGAPHAGKAPYLDDAVPDLCFQCHDEDDFQGKFRHEPVADGSCTDCHAPHGSGRGALVVEDVPGLCWSCHDAEDADWSKAHAAVADRDACLRCHSPHASSRAKLLLVQPGGTP